MLKGLFGSLATVALLGPLAGCSGDSPAAPTPASNEQAITGGVEDTTHTNVVFLMNPIGGCSGTLIAPNLVLTARHCVSQNISEGIGCDIYGNSSNGDHVAADFSPSSITVYTGTYPNFGSPVAAGAKLFHPNTNNLCNNDLSLILLNKSITSIAPAAIRLDWGPQIGEMTTAVGYGAVNDNQFGAGTRRHRDNVPVVTAGQDWNQVTGAGELAVGQAVCSGDSGGPIFSQAGGQIGIASRVTQCTDPNATAKYVRLDYHKDLILQAFAAAGASPILEPGSPPPPPTIKQLGEACTTGSQCTSLLCDTTNGNYCSSFCDSTTCPATMYCTDTNIVIGGQSVAEKLCVPLTASNACEQCRNTECVNVVSSCVNNPECKAIVACVDACADSACADACAPQHPAGAEDYDLLHYCACNSSCKNTCAVQCGLVTAGGGGGGGVGGAPGGGGAGAIGGKAGFGGFDAGAGAGNQDGGVGRRGTSSGGCQASGGRAEMPFGLALALLLLIRKRRKP